MRWQHVKACDVQLVLQSIYVGLGFEFRGACAPFRCDDELEERIR